MPNACIAPLRQYGFCRASRPRGVALVMVLLLLAALAAIALWATRQSLFGESMARNQISQQTARQAAEAALRDAERDLMLPTGELMPDALCERSGSRPVLSSIWAFDPLCSGGQCRFDAATYTSSKWSLASNSAGAGLGEPWWPAGKGGLWNNDFGLKPRREDGAGAHCSFTGGVSLGTFTGAAPIRGVALQPEYLIEYFAKEGGRNALFRITARGFGYSQRTQVVLQSYFTPETGAN